MADPIAKLRRDESNYFQGLIGFRFTECGDGVCVSVLEIEEKHFHSGGVVQGGVCFTMADASMATCLHSILEEGEGCSTIEVKISYLEPMRWGRLRCEARVIRRGKRVAFLDARVHDGDRPIAIASGTFAIFTNSA